MAVLDPIAGVTLAKYAELCAAMRRCGSDDAACVAIAAELGIDAEHWRLAKAGWNARMNESRSSTEVTLAYMPLFQAALARTGIATASLEDYAGMLEVMNHPELGLAGLLSHYKLDIHEWSQITTYWTDRLNNDPEDRQRFLGMTAEIRALLREDKVPPPGLGERPVVTPEELVVAARRIANLPPVAVGENCVVHTIDGKYPGKVVEAGKGECLIEVADGTRHWIPNRAISDNGGVAVIDPATGKVR